MGFSEFLENLETERRELTVVNRTRPEMVQEMLANMFARGQENVAIREARTGSGEPEDVLLLADGEEVLGVSPLTDVEQMLLLVNSDIYVTGTRPLESVDTPEVVARMDNTRVFAEGYPGPRKQKLLLIEISRYIERRAWRTGDGEFYSGFQRLSRIDDESGTHEVYERLGATDLSVHVFAVHDWEPPDGMGLIPHGHDVPELRKSWFVVYVPPRDEERSVALVAVQDDDDRWEAFWTHSADRVDCVREYVTDRYC